MEQFAHEASVKTETRAHERSRSDCKTVISLFEVKITENTHAFLIISLCQETVNIMVFTSFSYEKWVIKDNSAQSKEPRQVSDHSLELFMNAHFSFYYHRHLINFK